MYSENSEVKNSQLLIALHDAPLMDFKGIKEDCIWFTKKDRETRSSTLTPLYKMKDIAAYNKNKSRAIPSTISTAEQDLRKHLYRAKQIPQKRIELLNTTGKQVMNAIKPTSKAID